MTRSTRLLVTACLSVAAVAGCGGSDDPESGREGGTTTPAAVSAESASSSTSAISETTAIADVEFAVLSEEELKGALLGVRDLPPGYSADPGEDDGADKTFCDYEQPFEPQTEVRQDFLKGGGISTELLSVGLRQYEGPEEARASFDALVSALESCTGETYQGTALTYAIMSAPEVGDAAIGVRIGVDGTDLLQFFALVGPTMVNTGGGGPLNADSDEVTALLEAQVDAYKAAAAK